jgi:transcriptional regulator with XRE-family HTH domain
VPTYPTVKTPAERGPIGAWAYEARADADLSVEQVAERLTRAGQPVTASTLRGIEGGSKKPSGRLLRAMAKVYDKPVPGEEVNPAADLCALVARLDTQSAVILELIQELRLARVERDKAQEMMMRALGAALDQQGTQRASGPRTRARSAPVPQQ